LLEFYVVEDYDSYTPWSTASPLGAPVSNDGSTYNLFSATRVGRHSIQGDATFVQVWAVRANKRRAGLVDMSVFFDAWASRGISLGVPNYQIVGLEGTFRSGYTCVTAAEVTDPPLISPLSRLLSIRTELIPQNV
jgi:endo-1,4-beta-xylanase